MKFEEKYYISKWTNWNSIISKSITNFFDANSFFPNILEANTHTFAQIDFLINVIPGEKQRITNYDELLNKRIKTKEHEEVILSSFEDDDCNVDFAVNNKLENKEFLLIYDSDPDWDNDNEFSNNPINFEKEFIKT